MAQDERGGRPVAPASPVPCVDPLLAPRPLDDLEPLRPGEPLFLHSMWRTGSSYLLSRFEANPRYLAFYEPFNGEIGSARLRRRAAREYEERRRQLRHPSAAEGYFGLYDRPDPLTGRPLWSWGRPRLTLHDVYNGLSEAGCELLEACTRLAASLGRTPVFGFCHSGVQVEAMRLRFGGEHVYLYRPAADQFVSYQPGRNDFFMPATILQLLSSTRWSAVAVELVPQLARYRGWLPRSFVRQVPHWMAMRWGRRLARDLAVPQMYRLFLLSWHLSNGQPRQSCELQVSLPQLEADAVLRQAVGQRYGVQFDGLRYPPSDLSLYATFDREAEDERVRQVMRAHGL